MIYPGTDLKYKITVTMENFNFSESDFTITLKNRWGATKYTIEKDDCFYDKDGNYYFVVESAPVGVLYAYFDAKYEDEDYDTQTRSVTDVQKLCTVGYCDCNTTTTSCECEHDVEYTQVWTVSIDGGDYLCDCYGNYIYTSDGSRIQFTNENTQTVSDMGKVIMNMTGDEFLELMEKTNNNGTIDTIPEVMDAVNTLNEEVGNSYNTEKETLYITKNGEEEDSNESES